MSQRVPGSMRTRQSLSDLIEGRLGSPDGRAELVKLVTRLIIGEAKMMTLIDTTSQEGTYPEKIVRSARALSVARLGDGIFLRRPARDFASSRKIWGIVAP